MRKIALFLFLVAAAHAQVWRTDGTSMLPAIHPGDLVVVAQNFNAIHLGDVVIFRPAGFWTRARTVCHRVVRGWGGMWVTKGDHNRIEDPWYVTRRNYVATVNLILHP